jgi:hypothetical protein
MSEPRKTSVTDEELEQAGGEPLPDREAMSILPIGGGEHIVPLPADAGGAESPAGGNTLPVEPPVDR